MGYLRARYSDQYCSMYTLVYTTPIADICNKHQVHYHRFADDIQLYVSYNPAESEELNDAKRQLIQCIDEIRAWMLLHQLKLNEDKTEFMVLQSSHNLRVYGSPALQLTLTSTDTARNLGCFFDRHMQMDRLVSSYCSSAYYHLRTCPTLNTWAAGCRATGTTRRTCDIALRSRSLQSAHWATCGPTTDSRGQPSYGHTVFACAHPSHTAARPGP